MVVPILAGLLVAVDARASCKDSAAALPYIAVASDQKRTWSERRHAYQEALHVCPGDSRLYQQLAALLLAHHDAAGALSWLNQGLKLSPSDSDLQKEKASALLALGKAPEVLALFKRPSSGEQHFYVGLSYRQLQNHTSARQSFLDAAASGYDDDYVLYSIVQEDYALGDKQSGLDHFQTLLRRFPESPWVHLLYADAYFSKDDGDHARAEYLEALKRKPDILGANFRLGYLAFQAADRDAAALYFRNEIALNPSYVDAHVFLAETLLQQNRKQEALTCLRQALSLDKKSELAYRRLSTLLMEMNRFSEAGNTLKLAEQQFPLDPAFPAQRARVLLHLNQTKEAQAEAEHARQLTAEQHRKEQLLRAQ